MTDRLREALDEFAASGHESNQWFPLADAARAVADAPVRRWCNLHDLPMCNCGAVEAHCSEADDSIAPCVLVSRLLVDPEKLL